MESRILGYVDGRLKESERLEVEKHLEVCAACRLRVNEFRAVSDLLDDLPVIEPSEAFDLRVHARVAAEPAKQSWWTWLRPSPRVAFAATMLLVATVWIGSKSIQAPTHEVNGASDAQLLDAQPVLDNYDVLSNFEPLSDLPEQATDQAQPDTTNNEQM